MAEKSNEIRIPFAEWLYRMKQSDLPPQAMMLAVAAVFFKVSSNEQLARVVNMDTRGLADKTYNRWKYQLSRDGWVIIKQVTVGRRTTIEVHPSYKESPVKFTDFKPRDPAKLQAHSSVETTDAHEDNEDRSPVEATGAARNNYGPGTVESTGEDRNNYGSAVEITDEQKKRSPHTPLKENKTLKQASSYSLAEGVQLAGLNGAKSLVVDQLAKWINPLIPDQQTAERALTTQITLFGGEVVKRAFGELQAQIDSGGLVGRPIVVLNKICQRIKADPQKRPSKPSRW